MTDETARALAVIVKHPAWAETEQFTRGIRDHVTQVLARRLLAQGTEFPTEPEMAYTRGYLAGIEDILTLPAKAVKRLERLAAGEPPASHEDD